MYIQPNNAAITSSNDSPWLVRAEVTIRQSSPETSGSTGTMPRVTTSSGSEPSGLQMVYRWNSNQPTNNSSTQSLIPSSPSSSFGFRRGNILFTSTPPLRSTIPRTVSSTGSLVSPMGRGISVSDSDYTSEQLSQQSYSSLPFRRPPQVYNRRCKSTCNITLSTGEKDEKMSSNNNVNNNRSQVSQAPQTLGPFCNDPWSYRSSHQHIPTRLKFNTVHECCEDCAEGSAISNSAYTTHFCTRLSNKTVNKTTTISRDAASQTTDFETQHSPILGIKTSKVRRKTLGERGLNEQRKRKQNINSPPIPSSIKSSSSPIDQEKSDTSSKEDSEKRKSRTVHIDVYCTGTDDELNESSTNSSSSQDDFEESSLIFANKDIKVTHKEISNNSILPRGFQDDKAFLKRAAERRCESFKHAPMRMPSIASSKGYESDDVLSSLYPSRFSSYSALDAYDSCATSWKDTVSDIESLIYSRTSLTPCDSFEYTESPDREKIRIVENIRSKTKVQDTNKSWKSPQPDRKHLIQNKKMLDYMEKHRVGWSSEESVTESEGSDEVAWSFLSSYDPPSTVEETKQFPVLANVVIHAKSETRSPSPSLAKIESRSVSPIRSGVTSSTSRVSSSFNSRVTSPLMSPQGEKTDHIVKASRYGKVITAFKKPGHHIGPAKNPSCSCDHCRRYFEERSRDQSRSFYKFDSRSSSQLSRGDIRSARESSKN